MQYRLIGRLPDDVATWTGSAAELADKCNELMPACGLAAEAGSANERLVRHYVQIGVLTPPEREGRDALFAARQVGEFLAARRLLADGWPLAKIGELLRTVTLAPDSALPGLQAGGSLEPTAAEKALQRLRSGRHERSQRPTPKAARPPEPSLFGQAPLAGPLLAASEITRWRGRLRELLQVLGNQEGRVERQNVVRLRLAPWCHVEIDADRLQSLDEDGPDLLGNALALALRSERLRKERQQ